MDQIYHKQSTVAETRGAYGPLKQEEHQLEPGELVVVGGGGSIYNTIAALSCLRHVTLRRVFALNSFRDIQRSL